MPTENLVSDYNSRRRVSCLTLGELVPSQVHRSLHQIELHLLQGRMLSSSSCQLMKSDVF